MLGMSKKQSLGCHSFHDLAHQMFALAFRRCSPQAPGLQLKVQFAALPLRVRAWNVGWHCEAWLAHGLMKVLGITGILKRLGDSQNLGTAATF